MQLSENYWNDVGRYTEEILSGLEAHVQTLPLAVNEKIRYEWEAAEPDTKAMLLKDDYRILGIRKGYHYLGMVGLEVSGILPVCHIQFNPTKQVIDRVLDSARPVNRQPSIREDANSIWHRHKTAKKVGVLLPTEADYELLHSELRRGVDFRRAEMDN